MEASIRPAYQDLDTVRALFLEYEAMLGVDLDFQNFQNELETLPGAYALPRGRLYTATLGTQTVGCVALRPFGEDGRRCEMKRLYLRDAARGSGLGRKLAQRVVDDARQMGYTTMLLDTLRSLEAAVHLYRSMGFREVPPYRENPLEGVLYMGLDL